MLTATQTAIIIIAIIIIDNIIINTIVIFHFDFRMLSMSYPIGLAKPGNAEHRLSTLLCLAKQPLIARFMGPTWGPYGAGRTQVGPMLAPWTLLSGTPDRPHSLTSFGTRLYRLSSPSGVHGNAFCCMNPAYDNWICTFFVSKLIIVLN